MPIDYKRYADNWHEFSRQIRFERAENKCEKCKVPNGQLVARGQGWYMLEDGQTFDAETGESLGRQRGSEADIKRFTRIVLTVAHLDAPDGICQCEKDSGKKCANPEHVKAWCQYHHLVYDSRRHVFNARRTRAKRVGQQWLGDIEHRY